MVNNHKLLTLHNEPDYVHHKGLNPKRTPTPYKMATIEFNISFRTDKAGRAANQDNGFCMPDLKDQSEQSLKNLNSDRTISLGAYGALFVVADGMGGMNAGEKASELVVAGIKRAFNQVTAKDVKTPDEMAAFLQKAISKSDEDIKNYARKESSTRGMGSTVVALWIHNHIAVAAWVGDSRIYRFNPANGLVRLSHDHSYVQNLVDTGRLPEHMAFDHPDSNIITRSLGDNGEPARPETRIYKVYDLDEFLLCSDGLCGLLTDNEIEGVMRKNVGSSRQTLEALWKEGEEKGFTDNCTIEVICVSGDLPEAKKEKKDGYPEITPRQQNFAGGPRKTQNLQPEAEQVSNVEPPVSAARITTIYNNNDAKEQNGQTEGSKRSYRNIITFLIISLILVCGAVAVYYIIDNNVEKKEKENVISESNEEEENDDDSSLDNEISELEKSYVDLLREAQNGNISPDLEDQVMVLQDKCENISKKSLSDRQRNRIDEIRIKCAGLRGKISRPRNITPAPTPSPSVNNNSNKRKTRNTNQRDNQQTSSGDKPTTQGNGSTMKPGPQRPE